MFSLFVLDFGGILAYWEDTGHKVQKEAKLTGASALWSWPEDVFFQSEDGQTGFERST